MLHSYSLRFDMLQVNVLHWHMSDSQSFPFEVKGKGMNLWKGAYSDQEKFTQLDVVGVVEYARLRGVRVIVEFDMPGHAGSWCIVSSVLLVQISRCGPSSILMFFVVLRMQTGSSRNLPLRYLHPTSECCE